MKKTFLLLPLIAGLAYITLSSSSSGYVGANATGSAGGAVGCGGSGCHGSSATTGITNTIVLDSAGIPVTRYKAGVSYTIRLAGLNTTSGSLPKFGFQLSAVTAAAMAQAGTWGTFANGSTFTSGGLSIMTHNNRLNPSAGTGGIGTAYTVAVPWTAPAAGTGSIKIHGVINAVTDASGADANDKWNGSSVTITELPSTVGVEAVSGAAAFTVSPNPVSYQLQVSGGNAGAYRVTVFDINGKEVANACSNGAASIINTGNWASGIYVVNIATATGSQVMQVVKQ